MTKEQINTEALNRAQNGTSEANYALIMAGFSAMGIPAHYIKPRESVLTFHAWKALGRSVKKGSHGVRIQTVIEPAVRGVSAGTASELSAPEGRAPPAEP